MRNSLAGFLLMEWLMALALSMLVFVCLLTVYFSHYQRYQLQRAMLQNQQVAETVIAWVKKDVQLAGYIGCAKLSADFPIQFYGEYGLTPQNALVGDAQSLTVRHMEWPAAMVLKPMTNTYEMEVSDHVGLNEGNIVMIADCTHAEVFQVAHRYFHRGYQTIVAAQPLHSQFDRGAEVSRLVINTYRLRDTKRKQSDGSKVIAFSLHDIHRQTTDLVDGVDAMKIEYLHRGEVNVGAKIAFRVNTKPVQRWWHFYAEAN